MKRGPFLLVFFTFYAAGLALVIWGGHALLFHYLEQRAFIDERLKEPDLFQIFADDNRDIAKSNLFSEEKKSPVTEAGSFLNHRFAWGSHKRQVAGGLILPSIVVENLRAKKNDWMEMEGVDSKIYSTAWMREILKFNSWDLEKDGPIEDFLHEHPDSNATSWPTIETQAWEWARIRLIQAVHEKDPTEAFREVHHFAYLLTSTEDATLAYMAVPVLESERTAYNYFKKRGRAPNWEPPPAATTTKVRSVFWGLQYFLNLGDSSETVDALFAPELQHAGTCAAIRAGLWAAIDYRPLLDDAYPERFASLDRRLVDWRRRCRLGAILKAWDNPDFVAEGLKDDGFNKDATIKFDSQHPATFPTREQFVVVDRFPWMKRTLGLWAMSLARPDPFASLKKAIASKNPLAKMGVLPRNSDLWPAGSPANK